MTATKHVDKTQYDVVGNMVFLKPQAALARNYNVWLRQQFHDANRSAQLRAERTRLESFRSGLGEGVLKAAFSGHIEGLDKKIARLAQQGIPANIHPHELLFS